jgi:hypothetical protein
VPNDLDMSGAGVKLFAAIVERNVADAAFTTNALLDGLTRDRRAVAEAFADLYDSIAAIPDMIRTVAMDGMLHRYEWQREHYGKWLDDKTEG